MAWYNPATWEVFSDWGAASEFEDVDEAISQAASWIEAVADAKDWPDSAMSTADGRLAEAADDEDDVIQFWGNLAVTWDYEPPEGAEGWEELGDAFEAAAGAASRTAEGREQGTVGAVVGDAIADTLTDLDVTNPDSAMRWLLYAVLAIVALGVIVYAATRK